MNNQTTPVNSTILRNKLGRLAIRLQSQANPLGTNANFNTLEKAVIESMKILGQFYKQLSLPSYKPEAVIVDTVPDAKVFNNNFIVIQDDLEVIFSEFENLEGVILGEFNYMVSRLNRLNRKLKTVSSQLGDFALFSDLPIKDAIFYADSFNNLNRVEVDTPLLNKEQCEVNQVEGIVTLPIDRKAQESINITEVPVINSNSNGTAGNNEQAYAQLHGNISDILDNNADTWFEYERVVTADDGIALVLDFTVNMGEEKIVNFIRVNPNNFGTRTQVKILAIDTSLNGDEFVSIKDDIPIAGFTIEDEANIFTLAPSTSKYAGQGLYTFTPRKAKYIHFTLKQSSSYPITTGNGMVKQRYAIGVRDVDIQALPYKEEGEIISTNFIVTDEIRKVVLLSNQNPSSETTSLLASINHYISPDNGVTWHQIRPKASTGEANKNQDIPELLDFNGISKDSIITANDVKSLRYKAVLTRYPDAFIETSSELAQQIADTTELHTPPTTTPFEITLQQIPVDGSLKLIDPQFGSRGKNDTRYQIAVGTGTKQSILLPFKPLIRDVEKYWNGSEWTLIDKDPEEIYVDGELWARSDVLVSGNCYTLNYEEGKLSFGDGTTGNLVEQGSSISMILSEEQIFPTRGTDHIAKLNYPTSNDKKQIEVSILHPPKSHTIILKKGAKRWQLNPDIITNAAPYEIKFSDTGVFATEKTFGTDILSNPGEWYLDYTNGVLYSYSITDTTNDTTVIYFYNPRTILTESDWIFIDSEGGIGNAISISDSKYQTFAADTLTLPVGVKYFNLKYLGIVRGTVDFDQGGSVPSCLSNEVSYIDGRTELLGVVNASEELSEITGVTPGTPVSIPFKMKISTDVGFAVTFSDQTVFKVEKSTKGEVDSGTTGDYWIDRSYTISPTGRIYIKLSEDISEPGNVNYYYINPAAILTGRYSINYETGEVFTYTETDSISAITADYEYTNYRIKYDIARLVVSTDWTFDSKSNKIIIRDREILKNMRTPQRTGAVTTSEAKFYQASYKYIKSTRADVSELEPYFSPVLKDYALKIITRSRLV